VATETSTLGTSKTYTYDPAGQITSDGTHTYTWDKEGNNAASGWTTNSGNELSTDGTWNYSYDNAGNETQKTNIATGQVWLYYYDNANRLVKAEHKPSSGGAVDERILFGYDVFGNRIEQDVDPTGGGTYTTTKYACDPSGNAWADLSSGGTLQVRRLYADVMDALYAKISSGGVNWMLPDLVGSIRDITNSSGSLIDHRDWDPFGNLTYESNSSNGDRYGFTGREWSTELSLQYNRARWYDPATKRWMGQDPLGFGAGDSNLYRYVNNQPTIAGDPTGMDQVIYTRTGDVTLPDPAYVVTFAPSLSAPELGGLIRPKTSGNLPGPGAIAPPVMPGDKQLKQTPQEKAKWPEDKGAWRFFGLLMQQVAPNYAKPVVGWMTFVITYDPDDYSLLNGKLPDPSSLPGPIPGGSWLGKINPSGPATSLPGGGKGVIAPQIGGGNFLGAPGAPGGAALPGGGGLPAKGGAPTPTPWGWRDPATGRWTTSPPPTGAGSAALDQLNSIQRAQDRLRSGSDRTGKRIIDDITGSEQTLRNQLRRPYDRADWE
jgi:RHS repeat-associated protein